MKEERRRELDQATRNLRHAETRLETARNGFAQVLHDLVEEDEVSLGEVSKHLKQLGRPMSRQRVHQIVSGVREG